MAALEAALRQGHKSVALTISRMANGALSVSSPRAYLGKVKLQGRKTWMQYIVRNDAEALRVRHWRSTSTISIFGSDQHRRF